MRVVAAIFLAAAVAAEADGLSRLRRGQPPTPHHHHNHHHHRHRHRDTVAPVDLLEETASNAAAAAAAAATDTGATAAAAAAAAAAFPAATVVNPRIMTDGAFLHAPFDGRAYGFRTKPHRYIIPDRDGRNLGQLSWVEIATCCAAAPRNSHMDRDQANFNAFAPPPAQRCLSYEERFSFDHKPKTYRDDIAPKGVEKSPCPEQNPAFYKDLARDTYHPRHEACCAWFKTFLRAAWDEYPDAMSRKIIDGVNSGELPSVYERARSLVRDFDDWQTGTCHSPDGSPTDACCVECLTPHGNKLSRYAGSRTENMCSYFGDGWCSPHFKAAAAEELLEKDRRVKALQKNPDIMVDGAFNHRAVHGVVVQGGDPGQVYGTKITTTTLGSSADGAVANTTLTQTVQESSVKVAVVADAIPYVSHPGGAAVPIPDHDGKATGQMTWVEIARCCAATPSSSVSILESPDPAAFAREPAERCIDPTELRAVLMQFGNERSPCRRENAGYFKSVDGSYRPRYKACCEYMRHFFEGAPLEFADAGSQLVLAKIKAAGDLTVYSQSLSLLTYFNLWNKETCTDGSGSPTGRCCNDCIEPTTHKLAQYSGLAGLKACSADAEGWCAHGQRIPIALVDAVRDGVANESAVAGKGGGTGKGKQNGTALAVEEETLSSKSGSISGSEGGSESGSLEEKEVMEAEGSASGSSGSSSGSGSAAVDPADTDIPAPDSDDGIEGQEALAERFKQLEDADERLQRRAEDLSTKYKLTPSVNSILDRAKVTLLNEKLELRSLEPNSLGAASGDSPQFKNANAKLLRYKSVNAQLPALLENVEKFAKSGQGSLLEEFAARDRRD
jgi:hypothetical protein